MPDSKQRQTALSYLKAALKMKDSLKALPIEKIEETQKCLTEINEAFGEIFNERVIEIINYHKEKLESYEKLRDQLEAKQ